VNRQGSFDLLIARRIHEGERVAITEQILEGFLIELRAFQRSSARRRIVFLGA